jgi:glycogen synthase
VKQVDADPGIGPYGSGGGYARDFNRAVDLYNRRLVQAFDSPKADLLHCHDWITVPAAVEIKRRTGLPLVFTLHSTEYDRSGGFFPQRWIEEIEHRGLHGADQVIAVSRYTRRLAAELYKAPLHRVHAVHNGVDVEKFRPRVPRDYARSGKQVLFLARLSRQKGPLFFLQVAARVLTFDPDVRFVIAGTGELLGEAIEYAAAQGILDAVTFTGFLPDAELRGVYEESDAYILPSVSEPFGISVLEAMASGLPAIVTRSSGVAEAVQHVLKAPFWDIEEMADYVLQLVGSEELRADLGAAASHEATRFNWNHTTRQTLEVYRAAVASAGGRA